MAIPITVPRLDWIMEQGTFAGWLKGDGAAIRAGEPLFALETEKAMQDIDSLDAGILHIPADGPRQGDIVMVGAVIGFILQPGETPPTLTPDKPSARPESVRTMPAPAAAVRPAGQRRRAASSPRARRAAARLGIDLGQVAGSGRTGRIRERDVLAFAATLRGDA